MGKKVKVNPENEPKFVIKEIPNEEPAEVIFDRYRATTPVNIRELPSTSAKILGAAMTGQEIEVIKNEDGWLEIKDGGYTMAQFYEKV